MAVEPLRVDQIQKDYQADLKGWLGQLAKSTSPEILPRPGQTRGLVRDVTGVPMKSMSGTLASAAPHIVPMPSQERIDLAFRD